jgi:hypothetical protein
MIKRSRLNRALNQIAAKQVGLTDAERVELVRAAAQLDLTIASLGIDMARTSAAFQNARRLYCHHRGRPLDAVTGAWCDPA